MNPFDQKTDRTLPLIVVFAIVIVSIIAIV